MHACSLYDVRGLYSSSVTSAYKTGAQVHVPSTMVVPISKRPLVVSHDLEAALAQEIHEELLRCCIASNQHVQGKRVLEASAHPDAA